MKTYERLAEALKVVGLTDMAKKAGEGYYHDFLSPLTFPEMQLAEDLLNAALACPDVVRSAEIKMLRRQVMDGKYDADREESDAWANSAEGKDALNSLADDARRVFNKK